VMMLVMVVVTATNVHSEVSKCEEVDGVKGAHASVADARGVRVCKFPGCFNACLCTLAYLLNALQPLQQRPRWRETAVISQSYLPVWRRWLPSRRARP
jgi:hypothetical protein